MLLYLYQNSIKLHDITALRSGSEIRPMPHAKAQIKYILQRCMFILHLDKVCDEE